MSATQPIGVDSSPPSSEVAVRQQLDALAKGEIDHVTFLNNMKERFRYEPDDNWEVLSLLDQYYRRGKITIDVFRALKSGFAEYILGPQIPAPIPQTATPTLHTVVTPQTKAAAGAAAPAAATSAAPTSAASAPATSTRTSAVQSYAFTDDTVQIPTPAAFAAATAVGAATPAREAQTGDLLRNRFRLEGLLGRGASGNVFEANDPLRLNLPPAGKRVAIKVVRSPDPRGIFINQLRQEFHHLQLLSHPNIVRAFDFDRDGAFAFFTMELLNGDHLSRLVRARGATLQRSYALAIIRDVGAAITYAHSRGIAHGDINPQNVFITTRGEVRVLGFGASNKLAGNAWTPDFEHASAVPDTAKYASCEVLQGNRPDASDDLYSLSCLAYLLLAGKHPFADLTSIEARAERRRARRPPGLTYRQWLTLRAGLQTDGKKRPSDVQAWLDGMELKAAAKQLPPASELTDTPADKSRSWQWALAGLALAALLGADTGCLPIKICSGRPRLSQLPKTWRRHLVPRRSPPPHRPSRVYRPQALLNRPQRRRRWRRNRMPGLRLRQLSPPRMPGLLLRRLPPPRQWRPPRSHQRAKPTQVPRPPPRLPGPPPRLPRPLRRHLRPTLCRRQRESR